MAKDISQKQRGHRFLLSPGEELYFVLKPYLWDVFAAPLVVALASVAARWAWLWVWEEKFHMHVAFSRYMGALIVIVPIIFYSIIPVLRGLTTQYFFTSSRITTRQGIIKKTAGDLYVKQIANIYSYQGLFDRIFRCGTVKIMSTGGHGFVLRDIAEVTKVVKDIHIIMRGGVPLSVPVRGVVLADDVGVTVVSATDSPGFDAGNLSDEDFDEHSGGGFPVSGERSFLPPSSSVDTLHKTPKNSQMSDMSEMSYDSQMSDMPEMFHPASPEQPRGPRTQLPLGYGEDANIVVWDTQEQPHMFVGTAPDYRNRDFLGNIVAQAVASNWKVAIFTQKDTGLAPIPLPGYGKIRIISDEEKLASFMVRMVKEIQKRYAIEQELTHYTLLDPPVAPILTIIDETFPTLHAPDKLFDMVQGTTSEQLRARKTIVEQTEHIARLGKNVGIHLLLSTTHVGDSFLTSNFLQNIDKRVALGETTPQLLERIFGLSQPWFTISSVPPAPDNWDSVKAGAQTMPDGTVTFFTFM